MSQSKSITQAYIDHHVIKLLQLQQRYALREGPDFRELNPNQAVLVIKGDRVPDHFDEQEIMLASVPKLAINLALANLLSSIEQTHHTAYLDHATIVELFGRRPSHFLEVEYYLSITQNPALLELINKAITVTDNPTKHRELRQSFAQQLTTEIKIEVPVNEVMFQALTLSSNNATRVARELITQHGGDINATLSQIVPGYTPSPADMSQMQHWLAHKPNVGPISEHLTLLHKLAQKLQTNTLSPAEAMVVTEITNNPIDFNHCFTHSVLGRQLVEKGYRILEKTGYYPCVIWVRDFAEPPFEYPPHMVLATIVSIVPPTGEVLSLGYYQMYAVRLPITTEEIEVNGQKLTFPDDSEHYIKSIANPTKKQVSSLFRDTVCMSVVGEMESIT